jgi:hypothetical protein
MIKYNPVALFLSLLNTTMFDHIAKTSDCTPLAGKNQLQVKKFTPKVGALRAH